MVLVFDVNGTLLDTHALAPAISRIFGRKLTVEAWFTRVLQHSMAMTLAGEYREFGEIATTILKMAAAGEGVSLDDADIAKVQEGMRQLPPFPDVKSSLRRLRKANFRLAILTNSAPASLEAQLRNSGLGGYFEQALSVDRVKKYKPAAETYRAAAESLGVDVHEMTMVAAHPWDLMGAKKAGCRTAFVSRPGKALLPDTPLPDYVASDLTELTGQLLGKSPSEGRAKHISASLIDYAVPHGMGLAIAACGIGLGIAGTVCTRKHNACLRARF